MKLTTNHSTSSYGIPVFVDEKNNPIDYADGIRLMRQQKKWSVKDLAEKTGVSDRTVEGWEQGRMPAKSVLLLLKTLL